MTSTASMVSQASEMDSSKLFLKTLTQSSESLNSVPSAYTFIGNTHASSDYDDLIPIIDYSLLTSADPEKRSKAIQDLGQACEDWGFFMLVNHIIPESVMNALVDVSKEFFELPEEEKIQYAGKLALDPIRCGTSSSAKAYNYFFWRDYIKIRAHPDLQSPTKPTEFREIALEYSKRTREIVSELLKGISQKLGVEETYIEKKMNFKSCYQQLAANLYPACPNPDQAIGLPAHTDPGLFTILFQNGVNGLQVQHKGQWVNVDPIPNCVLVNTADQLEILSNGKYKSLPHRAVVNSTTARMSIASSHGPSLDTLILPAPEFVDAENNPAAYTGMTYREYFGFQDNGKLAIKPTLEWIRI